MVRAAPLMVSPGRFRILGPRVNRLHLDVKRPSVRPPDGEVDQRPLGGDRPLIGDGRSVQRGVGKEDVRRRHLIDPLVDGEEVSRASAVGFQRLLVLPPQLGATLKARALSQNDRPVEGLGRRNVFFDFGRHHAPSAATRRITSLQLSPGPRRALSRSTIAASTWMKHWPRSRCIGHRAAPLGSVEAMAS